MKTNTQTAENQPVPYRNARSSSRRIWVSWLAIVLLATSGTVTAATVQVAVGGGGPFFDPDIITIHPGDTVEWVWGSTGFAHTVTSGTNGVSDGLFDSGLHTDPYTFSFTFSNLGTFNYFCVPHLDMGMVGVVHVVEGTGPSAALGNISTRLRVEAGDNALIGGFIVTGTQPKKVIVRAIGPSLSSFFSGVLADPILELRDSAGELIRSNDNWRTDQEAEVVASTIPPSNDLESAIVATLPANNSLYTAIMRGVNSGVGIGIMEAYDLDRTVDSKLGNISTRGLVQTENNVLIGGLIVLGPNPLRAIVRAIGPSLPLPGVLGDPTLEVFDGNGAVIGSNNNWRTDQEAEIITTTIPPPNDLESAIVRDFAPGNYTAIIRGVNNTTGVAVVEAYGL